MFLLFRTIDFSQDLQIPSLGVLSFCLFGNSLLLCFFFVDELTVTPHVFFFPLKHRQAHTETEQALNTHRESMQASQQQQQLDVTRRRFVQAVLQPGPTEPVIEQVPEASSGPEAREASGDDAYDDQPEVFAMDADDGAGSSGSSSDAGTTTTSPTHPVCPLPQQPPQQQPQQPQSEFMPSIAVSDRRSSSRLSMSSSVCSSLASSAAQSLSRSGMGHSVVPTLTPPPLSSYARCGEDFGADDDDDGTTVVIAPHDVTAAISQPRVAASFGFVPPHLVADIPEY